MNDKTTENSSNFDEAITEYIETNDETNLRRVATLVLIIGIAISLIALFTITFVKTEYYDLSSNLTKEKIEINKFGLITCLSSLLGSVALWSFLRVICNISISLKEINANK